MIAYEGYTKRTPPKKQQDYGNNAVVAYSRSVNYGRAQQTYQNRNATNPRQQQINNASALADKAIAQQKERDRLNKLYGQRLQAQYQSYIKQWQEKQNRVWAGRLYGQLNQFQSYVPPEEYQMQYDNGGYGNQYGWDYGGGGGGGGYEYKAPAPEWYLQSVVWKI